jgi:PST family polysaccharide transporter
MLMNRQFDRWVVGAFGGTAAMGNYFVAQDFASSPVDEVVAPMARAAFPVYSRLRDDPPALADAASRMLSSVTAVSFATGLGMAAVAEDFVHVALGAKWVDAIPLMPWLGLFAAVYGVVRTLDMFLIATGGERKASLLALGYAVLVIPVLWYAGHSSHVTGIAATKALSVFVLVGALGYAVARSGRVGGRVLWAASWPAIVAATTMFAGVKVLQAEFPVDSHLVGLLRDSLTGAAVYFVVTFLIWLARGRPPGIERDLLAAVRQRLLRSRSKA